MGLVKKQIEIKGMACINCQRKIEETLQNTAGIEKAAVSYEKGCAELIFDTDLISLKSIRQIIDGLGYQAVSGGKINGRELVDRVCILVIILALYVLLQSLGILNLLAPSRLADTKMGYGMLFVIGLVTSVHCIAMCGGINLSQCLPRKQGAEEEKDSRFAAFRPAFLYNLGRVVSYTAIGFVLGCAGSLLGGAGNVGVSTLIQGILKMLAGIFMVIMGVNMLGLFPFLRKFTLRLPKGLARKAQKEKSGSNSPFYVGLLNGLMPCGPLQSMWIVAFAAMNPLSGALSMLLFSLGTVPLMLGFGSIVSALGKKFTAKVMTVGAVLVVVLGLAMLSQGGSLSGWLPDGLLLALIVALSAAGIVLSIPFERKSLRRLARAAAVVLLAGSVLGWRYCAAGSESVSPSGAEAEIVDNVQVVNSTLQPGKYPNITVQAGIPVKWIIDAPEGSINGCNYKIVIPDYGLEYTFQPGENVIEFTPQSPGTVRYSCWMGMIHGNIFVTDGDETAQAAKDGPITVPTSSGYVLPTENLAIAAETEYQGTTIQEVTVRLTDQGFDPAVIVVEADKYILWTIENSMSGAENGVELLAPAFSTKLTLTSGTNQLTVSTSESFEVYTGDNRFFAYIRVVDDLDAIDEEAIRREAAAYDTLIYPAEVFESSGMSCCN